MYWGSCARLAANTVPFVDMPRSEARDAHWVEPVLVAEVEFTEWSRDGRLRHPSFQVYGGQAGARGEGGATAATLVVPQRGPMAETLQRLAGLLDLSQC